MRVSEFTDNSQGAPESSRRLFGTEVEFEGYRGIIMRESDLNKYNWRVDHDGSLRDGIEYITRPMTFNQSIRSFRRLCEVAPTLGYVPSVRTGIHVHVDMRPNTIKQVAGVLATYAALEPILFAMAGQGRDECIYCVPWYRAPDQAELAQAFIRGRPHRNIRLIKYSALYLQPLYTYGTIEFRAAPTWMQLAPYKRWLSAINRLVTFGVNTSPSAVLAAFEENTDAAVRQILGWTLEGMDDPAGLIDEYDSLSVVERTLPCTYKVNEWVASVGEAASGGVNYHNAATRELNVFTLDDIVEEAPEPAPDYEEHDYEEPDYLDIEGGI